MSDDIIENYKTAPASLIKSVLTSKSIYLSSEDRKKLEELFERKMLELPINTDIESKIVETPAANKCEQRFDNVPRARIIRSKKEFCMAYGNEKHFLVSDLMKRFRGVNREAFTRDLLQENLAIIINRGVYVSECLRRKISESVDLEVASRYLDLYPASIDILIDEGRVEPFSRRINYLVMGESLRKVKSKLSETDRILLNLQGRRRALGEDYSQIENDLIPSEDFDNY